MTREEFDYLNSTHMDMYTPYDYDSIMDKISKLNEKVSKNLNGMELLMRLDKYLEMYNYNMILMFTALTEWYKNYEKEIGKKMKIGDKTINKPDKAMWTEEEYKKHAYMLTDDEIKIINELNTKYNDDGIFELM